MKNVVSWNEGGNGEGKNGGRMEPRQTKVEENLRKQKATSDAKNR